MAVELRSKGAVLAAMAVEPRSKGGVVTLVSAARDLSVMLSGSKAKMVGMKDASRMILRISALKAAERSAEGRGKGSGKVKREVKERQ